MFHGEYFQENSSSDKLYEYHISYQTLSKTLLILIKCTLNYIYANYQVYLIIFCLIMSNHSLLFGSFHKHLVIMVIGNIYATPYPGLQATA